MIASASEGARARTARVCVNVHGCLPYQAGEQSFVRGAGAYLFTEAGARCVDLVNAFGSVMLGHADPAVVAAVTDAVASGVPAGLHRYAAAVAERLQADTAPGARVAFFKTGTEAVRAAAVSLRTVRGRPLIVSAGFHGWNELWALPQEPFAVTPAGVFHTFYVVEALEAFLAERSGDVAAAVIAPDHLHLGADRLRRLIDACRRNGVPVVADDVKWGYRFGAGTSLRRIGADADVYVYAKGLANGWPLAAVVGPPELLDPMPLWCSTLTYEAPSLAAAQATLATLAESDAQARIARQGEQFLAGAREIVAGSRLPVEIVGHGQAFQFVAGDPTLEREFYDRAAREGLLLSPGDNQLPSLAFAGPALDDGLAALARVAGALATRFAALCGAPLTREAYWRAVWSQMDGFAEGVDAVPADVRDRFIARQLSAQEAP